MGPPDAEHMHIDDPETPVYRSLAYSFGLGSFSSVDLCEPMMRGRLDSSSSREPSIGALLARGSGVSVRSSVCAGCPHGLPPEFALDPHFELFGELFDVILSLLPASPDLFSAMAVSKHWRDAAWASYVLRTKHVPATRDALLLAAAAAAPGDTLLLHGGVHELSSELSIEKPLRLQPAPLTGTAVVVSSCPSLMRTRCNAVVSGLTLVRMGSAEGFPNAVVVADAGTLKLEGSRLTCGGDAPSVEQALQAFDGAPEAGCAWVNPTAPRLPPAASASASADDGDYGGDGEHGGAGGGSGGDGGGDDVGRRAGPQSGVWVGAGASVKMLGNTIVGCKGPGVKVYRGKLDAQRNTIAFSACGANVVANAGRVVLTDNEIVGARGDGVSSWNHACIRIERNRIHANRGTGITVNTGGGTVEIVGNAFINNKLTAVMFAVSSVKKYTEEGNDFSRNAAGAVRGLQRSSTAPVGQLGHPTQLRPIGEGKALSTSSQSAATDSARSESGLSDATTPTVSRAGSVGFVPAPTVSAQSSVGSSDRSRSTET